MINFRQIVSKLIEKAIREIRKPYNLYIANKEMNNLIKVSSRDVINVILPSHMGDVCYAMAYMHFYCIKMKKQGFKVIIHALKNREQLINLYNISADEIYYYERDSAKFSNLSEILCHYSTSHKAISLRIIPMLPYYVVSHDGTNRRDGLDIIRNIILGIGDDVKIEFPKVNKSTISSIPDFENIKNKIVIFNPYSDSMKVFDMELFEEMAVLLNNMGYILYTNVVGEQKEIAHTHPLNCSIFEFYNICNEIPFVVSIRSGIIDFCISTRAKFFVVHFALRTKVLNEFYEVFKLSGWSTKNVVEIKYVNKRNALDSFHFFLSNNNFFKYES